MWVLVLQEVPVFVVNLVKRPERRKLMEDAEERLGVKFTFMPAVDGRDPNAKVDQGTPKGTLSGRPRSRIDYACVSSHRKVWKHIIDEGIEQAIILEDDVVVADDFRLFTKTDWIPEDVDVVKLETIMSYVEVHDRSWNQKVQRNMGKLESLHLGAAGYLIKNDAATRLWEATKVPFDQIDHILFTKSVWKDIRLNVAQVDPAPVVQGMYHSEFSTHDWAQSSIQADRDQRGISINIDQHRQVGGNGGMTFRKLTRPKTFMHLMRAGRSVLNRGSYKRIQFG